MGRVVGGHAVDYPIEKSLPQRQRVRFFTQRWINPENPVISTQLLVVQQQMMRSNFRGDRDFVLLRPAHQLHCAFCGGMADMHAVSVITRQ